MAAHRGMVASGIVAGGLVAVKSVNEETLHEHGVSLDLLKKEVEILTRLSHPYIVRFFKIMSEKRQTTVDGEVRHSIPIQSDSSAVFFCNFWSFVCIGLHGIGLQCSESDCFRLDRIGFDWTGLEDDNAASFRNDRMASNRRLTKSWNTTSSWSLRRGAPWQT